MVSLRIWANSMMMPTFSFSDGGKSRSRHRRIVGVSKRRKFSRGVLQLPKSCIPFRRSTFLGATKFNPSCCRIHFVKFKWIKTPSILIFLFSAIPTMNVKRVTVVGNTGKGTLRELRSLASAPPSLRNQPRYGTLFYTPPLFHPSRRNRRHIGDGKGTPLDCYSRSFPSYLSVFLAARLAPASSYPICHPPRYRGCRCYSRNPKCRNGTERLWRD